MDVDDKAVYLFTYRHLTAAGSVKKITETIYFFLKSFWLNIVASLLECPEQTIQRTVLLL